MTGHAVPTGSPAPPQGTGLAEDKGAADDGRPADDTVPPLPRRIPGQASTLWPGREPGETKGVSASSRPQTPAMPASHCAATCKPTPDELGIDLARLEWECSGDGGGRIEVAFPRGPASGEVTWARGEWVLMRVTDDPASRILVFDRNEWECFLDGVRNGEFDDAV